MQKSIDDMNFKCPLIWSIRTLKDFISKYNQKAIHTYKLESWNLFFAGKILNEDEVVGDILQKVEILLFFFLFKEIFLARSFRGLCFHHQY